MVNTSDGTRTSFSDSVVICHPLITEYGSHPSEDGPAALSIFCYSVLHCAALLLASCFSLPLFTFPTSNIDLTLSTL